MPPKFKQIDIAQWEGSDGLSYSVFALGVDGQVYKFLKHEGWVKLERPEPINRNKNKTAHSPIKEWEE